MPKTSQKRRQLVVDVTVATLTVLLVGFGLLYQIGRSTDKAAQCEMPGPQHQISVSNDMFSTTRIEINKCDTVKIANVGSETYDFAFGVHDKHVSYPGFSRQALRPGQYFVLNAIEPGEYTMHDHLRDKAKIELSIRERQ